MTSKTGGQAVVDSLLSQGVSQSFGLISVHTVDIYDALRAAQDRIAYVGGRHESAVVYMADGYSRASGKPGVCFTSTGPGAANSIGAMGEAYACSSAVLNITSNCESGLVDSGRGALHEPRHQLDMFRSVTGWNSSVTEVRLIRQTINEAFARFLSSRPRPVEIEIPTDLLAKSEDIAEVGPAQRVLQEAPTEAVERAAALLASSRRPILWAGAGVISSDASPELIRLAESLGAPVTTSYGGKGAIPDDHPLALGCSIGGRVYGKNPIFDFIPDCDVMLVVGASLPYRITRGTGLRLPPHLIHIDIDAGVFGKNYPASLTINADARSALSQLLQILGGKTLSRSQSYLEEVGKLKTHIQQSLWDEGPNQQRVMDTIRSILARDAIVVADPAMAAYWATRGPAMLRASHLYRPSWMDQHRLLLSSGPWGKSSPT